MTDDAPEGLASTFLMLRRAYPQGLPNADYMPLLLAIGEEMSERQLATAIALLFERSQAEVRNDSAAAQSTRKPSSEEVARVRSHLRLFGYDEWVASDE